MNAVKMGMTIEKAAEYTGIGRNTMRKSVDWGKLPVLKVRRKTIRDCRYLMSCVILLLTKDMAAFRRVGLC